MHAAETQTNHTLPEPPATGAPAFGLAGEGFVTASGKVDGQRLLPREIFWRRYRPMGRPSGKVVVVSPGFGESGADWLPTVGLLCQHGHHVITMDHQWAGYTEGTPGEVDRGYSVARDVAAVAAMAETVLRLDYPDVPNPEVVLLGGDLGASAGVLGAAVLAALGRMELDGRPMPKKPRSVLVAPLLRLAPELEKARLLLSTVGLIPWLGDRAIDAGDVPGGARGAVLLQRAVRAVDADLHRILDHAAMAREAMGPVLILHASRDPVADLRGSEQVAEILGHRAHLRRLHGAHHRLHLHGDEIRYALAGL